MNNQEYVLPSALHDSPPVLEFRGLAFKYCALIESHRELTRLKFLKMCLDLLPDLYKKALVLPRFEPTRESLPERSIKHDEWADLFGSIRERLGKYDSYREVFDPIFPEQDDPTQSSLADDLADIYRDLKNGLIYWDMVSPTRYEDAVWEWSFNFACHWGQHLTSALRAIHFLVFDHLGKE